RRHRADLGEAEAEPEQRIGNLAVLVISGGHAKRVGKGQSRDLNGKARVGSGSTADRQAALQRGDRKPVCSLGVEGEKQLPAKPVEDRLHASSSGKSCVPSGRSGSGLTQATAARSSDA